MADLELESQIQKVREARARVEAKTQEHHLLQVEFNVLHGKLIEALCKARNDCTQEEETLRALTLTTYQLTGNKKPANGVGIKITKVVTYSPEGALQYAKEHGVCLELDRKAFEALAKLSSDSDIPAKISEIAQATIAREL